jgi:hypothetical protein
MDICSYIPIYSKCYLIQHHSDFYSPIHIQSIEITGVYGSMDSNPHETTDRDLTLNIHSSIPIGSMYGIYANIGGILMINVTIYRIHGSYGIEF